MSPSKGFGLVRKVILMGVDAATWSLIGPLISQEKLLNFSKILASGFSATLHSTIPDDSPPAWTSIFTGVNPGKHGIVDFYLRDRTGFVSCLSRYRMCRTIWDILSKAGRRCIIINDPVTYPPEKINGIMTTGLLTPSGSKNWVYPNTLRKEIDLVARGYEPDVPINFRELALDKLATLNLLDELARKTFRVSAHVAANFDWDVLATIYTTTDRLQHYYWNDRHAVSSHYSLIDGFLGEYLEMARIYDADLIVVSDHGFGPLNWSYPINEWLEQNNLAKRRVPRFGKIISAEHRTGSPRKLSGNWQAMFRALPPWMQDIARKHAPGTSGIDRSASQAYALTSRGVFVRDAELMLPLIEKLKHVVHEETGKLVFDNVLRRDEVLHGSYVSRAPDLFLIPSLGFEASISQGQFDGMTGTHRPEGIYMHYRSHSRCGSDPGLVVRPWDVAASILYLQGVSIPTYFDGNPKLGDFGAD
ncbi:MAG TPA: alkaline phosphatase family protein [Candidatus Bathyarchaeia archaeon]|nr:alkaline phosphatase family protein [Candidatus Bathyarchaeia archaeon]